MFSLILPTLFRQAQMTLKHAQSELKTKQAEMKKMDSAYKKDKDALQAVKSSREKLQAELTKLNYEGTDISLSQREASIFPSFVIFCICVCRGEGEDLVGKDKGAHQGGFRAGKNQRPSRVPLPQLALRLQVSAVRVCKALLLQRLKKSNFESVFCFCCEGTRSQPGTAAELRACSRP